MAVKQNCQPIFCWNSIQNFRVGNDVKLYVRIAYNQRTVQMGLLQKRFLNPLLWSSGHGAV